MPMIQIWTPDTCQESVVHQAIDDALPPPLRIGVYETTDEAQATWAERRKAFPNTTNSEGQPKAQVCVALAGLGETQAYYLALSDENSRKNLTLAAAQTVNKDIAAEDYTFSFDKDRTLLASFDKASGLDKLAIQTACDAQFGPGKVVVS